MDIIIIGGGASGLLLALLLSENKNNNITLIEKNNKLGKKLVLTGNGKCNFTNNLFDVNDLSDDSFYKQYYNNLFVKNIINKFSKNQLLDLFDKIGISYIDTEKYNVKYYYPRSNNSRSIFYNIYDKIVENKINIIYNEEFIDYSFNNNKYLITTNKNKYKSDILCIATGGKSYQNTGSDGRVINIMKNHKYNILEPLPALSPLNCKNDIIFDYCNNIRVLAKVTSVINDNTIESDIGEIQIQKNILSGIPIFQLSSKISRSLFDKEKVRILINFLYEFNNFDSAFEFIKQRKQLIYYKTVDSLLCSYINDNIILSIIKKLNINKKYIKELNDNELRNITELLFNYSIEIDKTMGFDYAQITSGGIDTNELTECLESKKEKDLYFIGEIVDIDGKCGGFNLQYAFSSAMVVANKINNG